MNPFNLEAAKRGEPVCTADGREVRLYVFDSPATYHGNPQPIVGVMRIDSGWSTASWCEDGKFRHLQTSLEDLRMAPRKETRWVVTWKCCGRRSAIWSADEATARDEFQQVCWEKQNTDVSINPIEVEL